MLLLAPKVEMTSFFNQNMKHVEFEYNEQTYIQYVIEVKT